MKLIPNYVLSGFSGNGNVALATRDDSTLRLRLDATYTRKTASYNGSTKVYSVPESNVTIRRDIGDINGDPIGQRMSAAVAIRIPVSSSESDLDALLTDLRAYVNDTDLKASLLRQDLPTCCSEEETP